MNEADPRALYRPGPAGPSPLVPAPFAEKAMASLMQLHGELMEEKERRVDLYRRLMEKEQSVAELRMYVHLLEERLGLAEPSSLPRPAAAPVVQARRQGGDPAALTTAPVVQQVHGAIRAAGTRSAAVSAAAAPVATTSAGAASASAVSGAAVSGAAVSGAATYAAVAPVSATSAAATPTGTTSPVATSSASARAPAAPEFAARKRAVTATKPDAGWKAW